MTYMKCDKCGSEENVTSIKFEYKEDSNFSKNVKHIIERDLCKICLKKAIIFIYKKDGE